MKKSFLLNDEERNKRKHRLDSQRNSTTNQQIPTTISPTDIDLPLTTDDQKQLDQVCFRIDLFDKNKRN